MNVMGSEHLVEPALVIYAVKLLQSVAFLRRCSLGSYCAGTQR